MRGIGETVPIRERIDVNVAAHTDQTQRRAPLLRGAANYRSCGNLDPLAAGEIHSDYHCSGKSGPPSNRSLGPARGPLPGTETPPKEGGPSPGSNFNAAVKLPPLAGVSFNAS